MKEYVTLEDIDIAFHHCARHKGQSRTFMEYKQDYIANNYQLYLDLNNMTYHRGRYICFIVTKPKYREVFCSLFRDRVVDTLIIDKFGEIFESVMSDDAYACRIRKGTYNGAKNLYDRYNEEAKKYPKYYVMKTDIQGFFMSINRQMLYNILASIIMDKYHQDDLTWWLWLLKIVITHDPTIDCIKVGDPNLFKKIPKEKSLFGNKGNGTPIGNTLSQVSENVMMALFDKWCANYSSNIVYCRYVDDCGYGCPDKETLLHLLHDARIWLKINLGLTLHPKKVYLQEFSKGIKFIGYDIRKGRIYSLNRSIGNMMKAIDKFNKNEQSVESFVKTINSYWGLLVHTNSYGIRWKSWLKINNNGRLFSDRMKKIGITYKYKNYGICKIDNAKERI